MTLALIGFAVVLILAFMRMPLGVALGLVGLVGFSELSNYRAGMSNAARLVIDSGQSYGLSVVPLFRVVLTHKTLGKLQSELLEWLSCWTRMMGVQDVGISKSSLKHKPKNVSVKFVAFHAYMVILPQLVIPVHPSHVALI